MTDVTESARGARFQAHIPPPYPDESLLGFVNRALSLTAVPRIRRALPLAGIEKQSSLAIATTLTDAKDVAALATLLRCDDEAISARVYSIGTFDHSTTEVLNFFGVKIRAQYRENKIRRVSPRALAIAPYHRAIWEMRPFSFDPLTREKLLDTCPVCGAKLGWARAPGPFFCDRCVDAEGMPSTDLRDHPQPIVDIDDVEALDFVTALVDPTPERRSAARRALPAQWRNFSNSALFETVITLASGLTMDPAKSAHAQGRVKRNEQFDLITPDLLALAGRAIIGGDEGFAPLAERYRADRAKRPRLYGRRKELGPLASITYDRHLEPSIRHQLRQCVDANTKYIGRKHPVRTKENREGLLCIEELARKFGLRSETLRRLSRSGAVAVYRSEGTKARIRMALVDIEALVPQLREAITEDEAAALLGMPLHVLPGLVERKLIDRVEWNVEGLVPEQAEYNWTSVQNLLTDVWNRAKPAAPVGAVPLIDAASSIQSGGAPWGTIVAAILAGDVEVFVNERRARKNIRYGLSVVDVPAFAKAIQSRPDAADERLDPKWIGTGTASEILKVSERLASRLAEIRPDLLNSRDDKRTPFLAAEVRRLTATYIFLPEVMDRADMHARRCCAWLRKQGVEPAFRLAPTKDFAYLRREVEPLIAARSDEIAERSSALQALADDVRGQLIKAVDHGAEIKATAERLGVPYRQAVRWVMSWRKRGVSAPQKFGVKSPLDMEVGWLRALVSDHPGISLSEIQTRLAEDRGVKRCLTAIWNCLERHKIELAGRRRPAKTATHCNIKKGDLR